MPLCGAYFYLLTYCVSVNAFSMLWICTSVLDISFLKMTEEDVYSLSTEKFTKKICIKDTVRKRFVNTENDNSLKMSCFCGVQP